MKPNWFRLFGLIGMKVMVYAYLGIRTNLTQELLSGLFLALLCLDRVEEE